MMCVYCDYQMWIDRIDDLLFDEQYADANDTLEGIRDWVESHEHITLKQRNAIENIEDKFSE